MKYLVCEKCHGYFVLQEGDSVEDFGSCECGGNLIPIENLKTKKKKGVSTKEINRRFKALSMGIPLEEIEEEISKKAPLIEPSYSDSNNEICRNCGTKTPKDAKFCTNCALPLQNDLKKICPHCGTENAPEAQFCQECAYNFKPQQIHQTSQNDPEEDKAKGLSAGEAVLIFLFSPLVGAILFLVWHDNKPKKAKQSGIIAIIAFVILLFVYVAGTAIYRAYFSPNSGLDASRDVNTVRQGLNIILPLLIG